VEADAEVLRLAEMGLQDAAVVAVEAVVRIRPPVSVVDVEAQVQG